jgi:hypothetical protein
MLGEPGWSRASRVWNVMFTNGRKALAEGRPASRESHS